MTATQHRFCRLVGLSSSRTRTPIGVRGDDHFRDRRRELEKTSANPRRYWLGATPAVIVVHVVTLIAGLAILLWENRHLWFFGDDWEFLVKRGLHNPTLSVWQPHNEHWSTLPILLYRLLFTLFGLHYFPYIFVAIVAHLVLAHLLWRTCLREAVDPWVATTFAALFVVLGSGAENLTWDFQVTFIGSLVFGYLALEVARDSRRCVSISPSRRSSWALDVLDSRGRDGRGRWCVPYRGAWLAKRCTSHRLSGLLLPALVRTCWPPLGYVGSCGPDDSVECPRFHLERGGGCSWQTFGLSSAGGALLIGLLAWTGYAFPRLYPPTLRCWGSDSAWGFSTPDRAWAVGIGRIERHSRYFYVAMALLIPLMATLVSSVRRPVFEIRVQWSLSC